ncbi:MAG TPA: SDR family NAD(P)-dependent oxidoreductase, partial [Myxococcales bacterium]
MFDFHGRVVLITGGSRGIGRACAVAFAKASATVIVGYARNEAAAQETVNALSGAAGAGAALRLDVADAQACSAAVESIIKEHGRFDVLVNNAGIAIDGLVMRLKDDDWDRQINTNLKGAFALIRAASRQMMKQKAGVIVNISSVVGETGNAGQAAYS